MPVRIRLELSDSEEIVIRCREETDRTERLMRAIEELLTRKDTVVLSSGGAEHFVPKNEILYFESSGGTVYAHTKNSIFTPGILSAMASIRVTNSGPKTSTSTSARSKQYWISSLL